MQKIRKGDDVVVIAGRDKGKRGTVLRIVDAEHVLVEGVNRVKKHQRPNPMKNLTGGIIEKEMPIHISNVALFNPATKKADRVGFSSSRTAARCASSSPTAKRWTCEEKTWPRKGQGDRQGRKGAKGQGRQASSRRSRSRQAPPRRKRRRPRRAKDKPARSCPRRRRACRCYYRETGRARPDEAVRLQDRDAGAAHRQDHAQHGRGRSGGRQEDHGQRRRRHDQDRRPEAGRHQGAQVDRAFKIRARLSGRLHGDAARRAHVRVPRPPGHVAMPRIRDFRGISAAPSTAAATTTWASRNRSSSPRSSTTRSTRSGA